MGEVGRISRKKAFFSVLIRRCVARFRSCRGGREWGVYPSLGRLFLFRGPAGKVRFLRKTGDSWTELSIDVRRAGWPAARADPSLVPAPDLDRGFAELAVPRNFADQESGMIPWPRVER